MKVDDDARWVKRSIIRINESGRHEVQDWILREEHYRLFSNDDLVATLHCLPLNLEELAAGYLFSQGLLRGAHEIAEIRVEPGEHSIHVSLRSEPVDFYVQNSLEVRLSAGQVHKLQEEFETRCDLFRKTGASHACALAEPAGITMFMEDVARHNSLDKLIGAMLLRGINPAGKIIIFSGRLASDMLEKVRACGVKMLIAPGAPSLAAVDLAKNHAITLLGFVRSDNINIYSSPERII